MKKEEWSEFRDNLDTLPPETVIRYLRYLLQRETDEEIRKEMEDIIKKAVIEIQQRKPWKREGVIPVGIKPIGLEETARHPEESPLEQTVEKEAKGKEEKGVNYSTSEELKYEKKEKYSPFTTSKKRESLIKSEEVIKEIEGYQKGETSKYKPKKEEKY